MRQCISTSCRRCSPICRRTSRGAGRGRTRSWGAASRSVGPAGSPVRGPGRIRPGIPGGRRSSGRPSVGRRVVFLMLLVVLALMFCPRRDHPRLLPVPADLDRAGGVLLLPRPSAAPVGRIGLPPRPPVNLPSAPDAGPDMVCGLSGSAVAHGWTPSAGNIHLSRTDFLTQISRSRFHVLHEASTARTTRRRSAARYRRRW